VVSDHFRDREIVFGVVAGRRIMVVGNFGDNEKLCSGWGPRGQHRRHRETMFGVGSWWMALLLRGGRRRCVASGRRQWVSTVDGVAGGCDGGWEWVEELEIDRE
jgi:hypothetical protein